MKELNIKIDRIESQFHVYHVARLFYQGIKINVLKDFDDELWDYSISLDEINNLTKIESKVYPKKEYPGVLKEDIKRALYEYFSKNLNITIPWGTMIGVRPTKLATNLLLKGESDSVIYKSYKDKFKVSDEKINLSIKIAKKELEVLESQGNSNLGIYINMPFCPSRCTYCSFLSYSSKNSDLMKRYLDALVYDIRATKKILMEEGLRPTYIYFGGGTPTAPNDEDFKMIMEEIYDNFVRDNDIFEFTVECGRQDTITEAKLEALKSSKVTRISINPQTFNEETLKKVGRVAANNELIESFKLARSHGFNNINMDLILGLENEGIKDLLNSLRYIEILSPESVTIHGLSYKKGSITMDENINIINLDKKISGEEMQKMYELCNLKLSNLNLHPYYLYRQKNTLNNGENIGYSKNGFENYYNIAMMEEKDSIIACGAAAITKIITNGIGKRNKILRHSSYKDLNLYLENLLQVVENKRRLIKLMDKSKFI